MKVLMLNGSSHVNGTTMQALKEMSKVFEAAQIETEIVQLGAAPLRDCTQCLYCQSHDDGCVYKDDGVNDFVEKAKTADGFVFASPTYFAHPSGRIYFFLDRVFFSSGKNEIYPAFQYKPAAAVAVARRAGTTATLDGLNKYFGIAQMPVAGSTYWNMVHGMVAADTKEDKEGLQVMRNLARNMIWMMQCFEAGKKAGVAYPQPETEAFTNFVR